LITTSRDPFAKQELLLKAAPGENIEPAVEDFLLDLADDFIDSVTSFACKLAAHRRSDTVEIDDIMVHLERAWGISVSGLWVDGSMKVCSFFQLFKFCEPSSHRKGNKRPERYLSDAQEPYVGLATRLCIFPV